MLRLSTTAIFRVGIDSVIGNQTKLARTQNELSTGKRINQPSDDPTGAVQALDLQRGIETTKQYQRNASLAQTRLTLAENVIAQANDELQRIRELTVAANNDTQDSQTRAGIAAEIEARLAGLVALANTRDANDEYIFAGFRSQAVPFTPDGSGGYVYNGDAGQRRLQISATREIADRDSGADVFMRIASGNGIFATSASAANTGSGTIDVGEVTNLGAWVPDDYTLRFTSPTAYEVLDGGGATVTTGTYTAGDPIAFNGVQVTVTGAPATGDEFTVAQSTPRDLFSMVEGLRSALATPADTADTRAQQRSVLNRALSEIDGAFEHLNGVRATMGARLNAIEDQQSLHQAAIVSLEQGLSDIQDLDYAEAVSRFNQQLLSLQAAQQTYTRVQGLSLFNYL
jgi:flagellar hook-associated protein 3 FlgL